MSSRSVALLSAYRSGVLLSFPGKAVVVDGTRHEELTQPGYVSVQIGQV